jgi:ubiquinone biosynthesis protein
MLLVDLVRLVRAGWVLAREGVINALPLPEPRPFAVSALLVAAAAVRRRGTASRAERLSLAFSRLGPSYVKLGQFLSTRPDLVGASLAADLSELQDAMPDFGLAGARAVITAEFGPEADRLFPEIGAPIAAASIAQVHKATVVDRDGRRREVAIKVLRPGVSGRIASDLAGFYLAARLIEFFARGARRLRPVAVVDTLARSLNLEMDFRLEAAALSEMAQNTRDDPDFRVPAVDWRRTTRQVLTLEWIDGIKLSDVAGIAAAGHDLPKLAAGLLQSFLRHALRDGFFHADMHQGNLFVDPSGRIVAVDFGIMGRLGPRERRYLAEILHGFITRNYRRVAEVHFEAGYVPADQDLETFAQALRAVGEPLHGIPAREIAMSRLLNQLFETTELFAMQTRPELILLQKTMVVVEGVARTLDPDLDMWKVSEPVVGGWIARNLGPLGRIETAVSAIGDLAALAPRLPKLFDAIERLADRADGDESRLKRRSRAVIALPLWIGAAALAVIAGSVLGLF